jgi:hypothetical protein
MDIKDFELEIKEYLNGLPSEILLDDYHDNAKDFDALAEQYVREELEAGGEIASFIRKSKENRAMICNIYYKYLSSLISKIESK